MRREDLPIRFPCPDKNKQLSAVPGQLYCATCDRDVIELDRLTAAEVRKLKKRAYSGERICVRYRVDGDGLIQLRPSPPIRPLGAVAAAAGLAAMIAGGGAQADSSVPAPVAKAPCARSAGAKTASNGVKPVAPQPPGKTLPAKAKPAAVVVNDMVDGGI